MTQSRQTAGFGTMADAISQSVPAAERSEYVTVRFD
jgi:hypothetical protein